MEKELPCLGNAILQSRSSKIASDCGVDAWVRVVCRALDVTQPTYDRWRKEYWGLKADQATCLTGR